MIQQSHSWAYHLKKTLTGKDICTPMFISALFTIVKTWKQPKCPSTDEQIKKMWYIIYYGILLSYKKEWNNAICSNMDGPRDYHTKWSKPDRERQLLYDITYTWNLKNSTNEHIYKTGTDSQIQKTNLWLPKGKVGRDKLGVGD